MNWRAHWRHITLTAALGLVAGLFAARLLAEEWPATFAPLYEPVGATVLALLTALLLVVTWLVAHRLTRTQPDAMPLLPLALLGVYVVQPGVNLTQAWMLLAGSLLLCLALYVSHAVRARTHRGLSTGRCACRGLRQASERFTLHASHAVREASERFTFLTVTLIAFLLYLRTLAPGVVVGDAAEFQTVLPTLGIAHPTGYPLYTLLGWLITRVPLGEVAWRVNLFSAVCGALTVGVVYLAAERLVEGVAHAGAKIDRGSDWQSDPHGPRSMWGKRAVAAIAALAFAVTPTWWAQCVMAEIYALGTLLLTLVLYFFLRWGDGERLKPLSLGFGIWILGLGFAHHRTIVLLVPAALAYVLLTDWRIVRRPREWLPALLLALLPLALYVYFPLRWPALHDGQPMTGEQFQFLVLAQGYAPALRLDAILAPDRWDIYLRLAVEQFGPVGLAFAAGGVLWLGARRPRALVLTGLLYAATVLFGLAYFVPDVSVFFIPAHLVTALWIGCGLWGAAQIARRRMSRLALRPVGLTVAALLPLALAWTTLPAVDLSGETAAQDWGEHALSYPLGQNAVIVCDVHRLAPLNYLAHGAGHRPDLEIVMPDTEAQSRDIIARALAAGRPVYLARFVPGLESVYALRSLGPLVEVSPTPLAAPPPVDHATDAIFGDAVRLLGYQSPPTGDHAISNTQYPIRLTLVWQSLASTGLNLHPRLRLVDAAGRTWAEEVGRPPVDGLYPTTAWPAGSVVPDYHELTIPPGTPPGEYRVQVRLTPPFAQEGLPTSDGTDAVTLETVAVPPLAGFTREPDHPARARFDHRILMGYDQDEVVRPGGRVRLTLYWRATGAPEGSDVHYVVRWAGEAGSWETSVPTSSGWQPGEVRQETLTVPVPLSPTGPGQIWLSLRDANGDLAPVRAGWLAPPADWCSLKPLDVAGTPITGLANFDDKVLLLDVTVSPTTLSPGEELQVTLRWQGVGRMDTDYTVFLHLLDAGERIHGQTDAQPIYGTRPTSTWQEGEVIAGDVYAFPVSVDAPPGTYRLEVGLYDAASMTRLNVLSEDLQAIGDRVFLPQTVQVR